jgi:N-acetylglucosaminyl-diphospho-decaprenol L-rhamnosyltransferase
MPTDEDDLHLDIVIVNWNSGDLLARCVESVPRARVAGVRIGAVIIVDNASADGSASIRPPLDLQVEIIRNERNRGFAAACNQGAQACSKPHILFLNPDTELGPTALSAPLQRAVRAGSGRVGIFGIALVTSENERQRNVARFPTAAALVGQAIGLDRLVPALVPPRFLADWDHLDTREIDQVPGAFMLMRRKDFQQLGGFDEQFFLYMEDVDLALRARKAGLTSLYVHDCVARHVGGGTTAPVKDRRLFYLLRSRVLFARNHFGAAGQAAVTFAAMGLEPLARLAAAAVRADRDEAAAILRSTRWLWRAYPFRSARDRGELDEPAGEDQRPRR